MLQATASATGPASAGASFQGEGVITFLNILKKFGGISLNVAAGTPAIQVTFVYDKLVSGYIPEKGDNVSVTYSPQPNGKNFATSVEPLSGGPKVPVVVPSTVNSGHQGVVFFVNVAKKFGSINVSAAAGTAAIQVSFRFTALVSGYIPEKGDNVSVTYSPQPNGKNFATSVEPLSGGAKVPEATSMQIRETVRSYPSAARDSVCVWLIFLLKVHNYFCPQMFAAYLVGH